MMTMNMVGYHGLQEKRKKKKNTIQFSHFPFHRSLCYISKHQRFNGMFFFMTILMDYNREKEYTCLFISYLKYSGKSGWSESTGFIKEILAVLNYKLL